MSIFGGFSSNFLMKTKLFLLVLLISSSCFAQFSKTHYIPPLSNTQAYETLDQYLYISCPSITDITYKITAIGGATTTGTVRRDNPQTILIGNGDDTQILANGVKVNIVLNNKGYIIEAEDLVYVTVRLTAALNPQTGAPNHAGGLVSKGLAALGTQFRIGAFINTGVDTDNRHYTFASILATENNTVVSFSDLKPGVSLINNAGAGNTPASVTLNSGESFIMAVQGPDPDNADGLIGALISSTKPIAVNCGSYGGTNGDLGNSSDIGFDQIVSAERLKSGGSPGAEYSDYIFIRGNGQDIIERPLIVCHENNTQIFLNGSPTPAYTKNAGEYVALSGTDFSANGNLFVHTSKPAFAYQGIGGSGSQANQNMSFLPPLSCETPKVINNIPFIDQVGSNNSFSGTVCIVTETGATLNFIINGTSYTLAALPTAGITVNGPFAVTGNTAYETYTFEGFSGNVSVFSSKSVYLSYFGSSGAATYGGFYSGFTFKPEIAFNKIVATTENCIPNVRLVVNNLTGFDVFQWYFNGAPIAGATANDYNPTQPGYYHVKATIAACGTSLISDEIPVSSCPTNMDNDLANDNIDIDNDNDGITNCTESFGNQNIDISNPNAGTIALGTYSNTFTGVITNSSPAAAVPFTGNPDGSFVTEMPAGKGYNVVYEITFAQPANVSLEYPNTANPTDLLNANAEYIVNSDTNKTVTILNPTNQLLIDTNFDGIYESGVTQFSSFEIRFRLNGNTPLAAGTGTFKFQSYQATTFKITHRNLLDSAGNKSTFKLIATCIPKDTDSDGIPNQLDTDSDNDGILDVIEAQVNASVVLANADTNLDGLDNAFEPGFTAIDTDADGIADYLDLDSDNDGILDLNESTADTDGDGIPNYRELDSDNDLCNDVIEAGFLDPNGDGILGNNPVTISPNGEVASGVGYTAPNANYVTAAPIAITTQPTIAPTCELQNVSITLADNGGNTYQWQLSTDGITWNNIVNNATYSGATTNTLNITSITNAMNGYKYRVRLDKVGNSCGLISADATLTVYALPVVNSPITIIQCDDDLDAVAAINLTINNNLISANYTNETFTYYTTLAGAQTADTSVLIANPLAFTNTASPGAITVWTRVVNANGCFSVAQINAQVIATQIPTTYSQSFTVCDDYVDAANDDHDGIATFDISSVTTDLLTNVLPAGNYAIKYYRNITDRDAQINAIPNIANFRNDIPSNQIIWGRVDSTISNACYGFARVFLTVEKLPTINTVAPYKQCDDDNDGITTFNTSTLESTLLGGQSLTNVTITYFDASNNPLPSPFPATFATASQTIRAVLTNNTTLACSDDTTISFTVDVLPTATLPSTVYKICDDELNPTTQNGLFNFNTATLESDILNGQSLANFSIEYFDAANNPLRDSNGNLIVSPFPATFNTATQTILVVVKNKLNPNCTATVYIPFEVDPLPNINLLGDEIICQNLSNYLVTIDAGLLDPSLVNNYNYTWSLDNTPTPLITTYSQQINQAGVYTVIVSDKITNCSSTRNITVHPSDVATILPTDIIDLVDHNSVTIIVSGPGDYWYSIDEESGPFQESNIFTDVAAGIHTIYVKDMNGCGVVSKEIYILGVPKYFTPNGDGTHDYWNVRGVSASSNGKTTIYIFDRYGKLLKQISPLEQGWNGTFNGKQMPADDYWYSIQFEDGRTIKGNFALKR